MSASSRMHIMLCLKFWRSAPSCTISNGLFPPTAAVFRRSMPEISAFKSVGQGHTCRLVAAVTAVIAKQHLSCVNSQHSTFLSNKVLNYSDQTTVRKGLHHWFGPPQSTLLSSPSLAQLRALHFFGSLASTQSSIRHGLAPNNPGKRSHATAYDPSAILVQPLDPSCRRQSVRRGFAISLPILLIYVFLYLLSFAPHESTLGRYASKAARFQTYQRQESFPNLASLSTYVMSQFTHNHPIRLVFDSMVLVGIASILGSVVNRRSFFAIYVLGGFLAAAADCAWARFTNPCRSLAPGQRWHMIKSTRLIYHAKAKYKELTLLLLSEIEDPGKFELNIKGLQEQIVVFVKYYPVVKDWVSWTRLNWASSGSLVCLRMLTPLAFTPFLSHANSIHPDADVEQRVVSVATILRPRTIITFVGVRPGVLLYKLTACIFVFNIHMQLAKNNGSNHAVCLGGSLAAVVLWLLWLGRGPIGVMAPVLRAFDQLNKPAMVPSAMKIAIFGGLFVWLPKALRDALAERLVRNVNAAKETKTSQRAVEEENSPPEEPKEKAADDTETQETNPTSQPATEEPRQNPRK